MYHREEKVNIDLRKNLPYTITRVRSVLASYKVELGRGLFRELLYTMVTRGNDDDDDSDGRRS